MNELSKTKKKTESVSKPPMRNITINIPNNYDDNIQKLIKQGILSSRSEAIREAIHQFLQKEYNVNLELLEFFENKKS